MKRLANMTINLELLLADDDSDDRLIFKEALDELKLNFDFNSVNDGEQLMYSLTKTHTPLPYILFLDLNMPRKNGFECLTEIKNNDKLKNLPVIIYSTSYDHNTVNDLYKSGAHHYICKPSEFKKLKSAIEQAISSFSNKGILQPGREKFVIR